jgi:hypothetical protein
VFKVIVQYCRYHHADEDKIKLMKFMPIMFVFQIVVDDTRSRRQFDAANAYLTPKRKFGQRHSDAERRRSPAALKAPRHRYSHLRPQPAAFQEGYAKIRKPAREYPEPLDRKDGISPANRYHPSVSVRMERCSNDHGSFVTGNMDSYPAHSSPYADTMSSFSAISRTICASDRSAPMELGAETMVAFERPVTITPPSAVCVGDEVDFTCCSLHRHAALARLRDGVWHPVDLHGLWMDQWS